MPTKSTSPERVGHPLTYADRNGLQGAPVLSKGLASTGERGGARLKNVSALNCVNLWFHVWGRALALPARRGVGGRLAQLLFGDGDGFEHAAGLVDGLGVLVSGDTVGDDAGADLDVHI